MGKHKVLSTKNLRPDLKKSTEQNSIDLVETEFISIKPILTKEKYNEVHKYLLKENVYAIFTSANAIGPFKNYMSQNNVYHMVNWKIFCLSNQTKKALYPYFSERNILETADNALMLAQKIISHGIKELVFFCGNKRREELPLILKNNGINLHEVIVYETLETPILITQPFEAILFFSPSAVNSFFSMNQISMNTLCFAIGQTTANAIRVYTKNKIITSPVPSPEAMIEDLIKHFTTLCN